MDILQDPAVIWFLVGLGLLLLELALPGLVILFFGAGAWVTALVCAITDIKPELADLHLPCRLPSWDWFCFAGTLKSVFLARPTKRSRISWKNLLEKSQGHGRF